MTRRVVHFVDSDAFGGTEQAILTLLAKTNRTSWDPVLACHGGPGLEPLMEGAKQLGVRVWIVPPMFRGWRGLRSMPVFVSGLRRLSPAIVHLHLTWPLACQYALVGAVFARVPGLVATAQVYVELQLSLRNRIEQRILTRAVDRYIAVSEHIREQLVDGLHWPRRKIDVVHNSVDAATFPKDVNGAREQLSAGAPVVLVPSRLAEQKGQRYMIEAATRLPNVRVVFAGDGPDRCSLERLAEELGVAERLSFLGFRRDISDLIRACDVVALPSIFEGLSLALLEAMAAGKPVVATDIGGMDEAVTSGRNGVLVPPRDAATLASAIQDLIDDRDKALRLGEEARRTVAARFSADETAQRVMDIYEQVLAD